MNGWSTNEKKARSPPHDGGILAFLALRTPPNPRGYTLGRRILLVAVSDVQRWVTEIYA